MRSFMTSSSFPDDQDPPQSASEGTSQPVTEEPTPSDEDRAWERALGAWVDAEVRSTPISQHGPGWDHLINVALPKLRGYVERELKGS